MCRQKDALISVIVPVYNVEKYINRCIESVLAQTYRNFELILVDDGSPDNCGAICDDYASKDRRIRVIHKENGGVSSARNAGLDSAGGDYILFVDSDDYITPEHIELLIPVESEDLVCCGLVQCINGTASNYSFRIPRVVTREEWAKNIWAFWRENAIMSPCCSCYSAKIIRDYHL